MLPALDVRGRLNPQNICPFCVGSTNISGGWFWTLLREHLLWSWSDCISQGDLVRPGRWLWLQCYGVFGLIGAIIVFMLEALTIIILYIKLSLLFPLGQIRWTLRRRFVSDHFSRRTRQWMPLKMEAWPWWTFGELLDLCFVAPDVFCGHVSWCFPCGEVPILCFVLLCRLWSMHTCL